MKILEIYRQTTTGELKSLLQEKLNQLFNEQREKHINFTIEENGGAVEIYQLELYEGSLYHIEIEGTKLRIIRSEHYTDDVNSLTLESILNILYEEIAQDGKVTLVQEG